MSWAPILFNHPTNNILKVPLWSGWVGSVGYWIGSGRVKKFGPMYISALVHCRSKLEGHYGDLEQDALLHANRLYHTWLFMCKAEFTTADSPSELLTLNFWSWTCWQ